MFTFLKQLIEVKSDLVKRVAELTLDQVIELAEYCDKGYGVDNYLHHGKDGKIVDVLTTDDTATVEISYRDRAKSMKLYVELADKTGALVAVDVNTELDTNNFKR